jgi:hypothetical protein
MNLKTHTVKDLAEMAKRHGVSGWHSMRKEQLIKALAKHAKTPSAVAKRGKSNGSAERKAAALHNGSSHSNGNGKAKSARVQNRLRKIKERLAQFKDLAFRTVADGNGHTRDKLVVMVRDSFWLHAYWEIARTSIERARVAMGQHWHGARPVLRLHEIAADGTTSSARQVIRHIEVHGGVNNWYVDVRNPPKSYQLDVGYLSPGGKFYALARSNVVSTPAATPSETFDQNWAEVAKDCDRIYALSGGYSNENGNGDLREVLEEHTQRPMGPPVVARFGLGAGAGLCKPRHFHLEVDAELVVFGSTDPNAHVTVRGEPVRLQPDGSFMVRFALPERRQVLPIVAGTVDGSEQRTIVLAVERNTKVMEPVLRETSD